MFLNHPVPKNNNKPPSRPCQYRCKQTHPEPPKASFKIPSKVHTSFGAMGTYWTNCGRKINARIVQKSPNVLNLSIENTELVQERLLRLKLAAALLFLYAFLILVPTGWNQLWIHGIFVVLLGGVAYSYTKIVKNGKELDLYEFYSVFQLLILFQKT